jgi:hypothetical protein
MKGLPIQDSIKMKKEASIRNGENGNSESQPQAGRPELYVTAKDDVSVSSNLSDPDDFGEPVDTKNHKYISDEDSDSHFNFGSDAPWMASASSLRSNGSSSESPVSKPVKLPPDPIEEEDEQEKKPRAKKSPPQEEKAGDSAAGKGSEKKAQHERAREDNPAKSAPVHGNAAETSENGDSVLVGDQFTSSEHNSPVDKTKKKAELASAPTNAENSFAYSTDNSDNYVSSDDER